MAEWNIFVCSNIFFFSRLFFLRFEKKEKKMRCRLFTLQKHARGADRSPTAFPDRRTYADGQRRPPYDRRCRHVSAVRGINHHKELTTVTER